MDLPTLLERAFRTTAEVAAAIEPAAWDGRSPCPRWSVRQVGSHMLGMVGLTTHVASGLTLDPAETQPERLAQLAYTDRLGADPAAAIRAVGDRSVAVFAEPGTLERLTEGKGGADTPGSVHALMCINEVLTHGWDLASGGGVAYEPDAEVVATAREFALELVGPEARALGMFGPAVEVGADADVLTAHLGHTGRRSPWPGIRAAA
ncbi:TIGR03086 family metal-binding protein [Amycolatopsis sp. SID8362]|uniref:TIGR03086 family metal-binding protein n=1 Tax=Amycolatopsis sp. SID8362 TaxID=2690346 RepID=UPI00136A9DFA|nr:TIGR03086 family metal-binding protein [Amycolatopsis sp. SID8362]NBH09252.1 TIGR03086 family protein [Amycolatopsis sp. SID8362]NED45945.1 TIGR03086 family protein [Amycolatopsis sp. SID8362]